MEMNRYPANINEVKMLLEELQKVFVPSSTTDAKASSSRSSNVSNEENTPQQNLIDFVQLCESVGFNLNTVKANCVTFNRSVFGDDPCLQVFINCIIGDILYVELEIVVPITKPTSDETRKLRIQVSNTELNIKDEMASCVNYLQRQRNPILALSVLTKYALLINHRKIILSTLLFELSTFIHVSDYEDGGCTVLCINPSNQFKFFECIWPIRFNYNTHHVFDSVEFALNKRDLIFHADVKPYIEILVRPNLILEKKACMWGDVIICVKKCAERHSELLDVTVQDDTIVDLTDQIMSIDLEPSTYECDLDVEEIGSDCEIIDSDSENCVIIED